MRILVGKNPIRTHYNSDGYDERTRKIHKCQSDYKSLGKSMIIMKTQFMIDECQYTLKQILNDKKPNLCIF